MLVSIIIINYNTFALTSACIRSVIRNTKEIAYEIILVDNGSTECDADLFLNEFPKVVLVKNSTNSGFAHGNNLGISKATGTHILLLNSDTELTEDSISKSAGYWNVVGDRSITGPRMIYPDGAVQYTARRFRSIKWEIFDLFRFLPYLLPYKKRAAMMLGKYFKHDTNIQCDWLNGAFLLFPVDLLKHFPDKKLDERFFMYGEDQLWCEQARNYHYHVHFYTGTTIIHHQGASTSIQRRLELRKLMRKNELTIMRLRKGNGLYYYLFKFIFVTKEKSRNLIMMASYKLTGRWIR